MYIFCQTDFLTNNDASTYAEAQCHTEARCLVTALRCGYHVFEFTLKVKGVNQPFFLKRGGELNEKNTGIATVFSSLSHLFETGNTAIKSG